MAPLSSSDFLDWLIKNEFLSETRAQPFRNASAAYPDARALAVELIHREWLTPYQVNQILQGKGDELVLGPYHLRERIGEGAMGQVFKAWDPNFERWVAIKRIHKEHVSSKKAMERFRREMETAGQLNHPNIVFLRSADEVDGRPYMVMEFIEGTDLSQLVKKQGPLPVWQAADFARQAALGLQHAVERDVIHRDIKPGNLLITSDPVPVVKILDFGLARFESNRGNQARLTQYGAVLGTIDYIAPEQAENAQVADVRADIYSLGCTLYFLLTGRPPFPGTTIVEKISARLSGDALDVRSYRPDVPAGLNGVLRRMMARALTDRYQAPHEVAAALQPFCHPGAVVPGSFVAQAAADAPLARPVAGLPVAAAPMTVPYAGEKDPFTFSHSDVGTELVGSANGVAATNAARPAPMPVAPVQRAQKAPHLLVALGGAGSVILLVGVLIAVRGCSSPVPSDVYPPDAGLKITLKERERTLNKGDRKQVIFTIERIKFDGKVQVVLDQLPQGISTDPNPLVLGPQKDQGEIPLTVTYFAHAGDTKVRIRATAKNLSAVDWLNLTIIEKQFIEKKSE